MGKKSFYLGEAGAGANMKLVVNMVMGSMMAAFGEGMALAEQAGLSQGDLLEVLDLGAIANPMFKMKGGSLQARAFPPAFPLKHQQKDMRLALALGTSWRSRCRLWRRRMRPTSARARKAGHGDSDFAAVYEAIYPKAK
jgi:glyoxylate/succinic semialdehyde reductase